MPGTTRLFGLILIVLGVASYQLTGRTSLTAMIPAFFGVVLVACAMIARAGESARKHAMHAAVAVGLLGAPSRRWRAACRRPSAVMRHGRR
jgi:hypothetical protein